jgi:hypothetical protein
MDMKQPPSRFDILIYALWIFMAGYGGAMSYLMKNADKHEPVKFWRVVLEFCAAVSVGTIVTLMCAAMGWGTLWTGVIVSSSGWIGAKGVVSIIEAVLLKKAGLSKDDIADNVGKE